MGKGGKIEEHAPATSYETVSDPPFLFAFTVWHKLIPSYYSQVPHPNIDNLKAFNVPHSEQK
jgi:hypothetical protein